MRSDEKINDQITFKFFDGSTNPKNINSDMVVGLRLKKGMNNVKTKLVVAVSKKLINKYPGPS